MGKKRKERTFWKDGHRATAFYQQMAPRKIRPIADLVREKNCVTALATLEAMPNKSALLLKNVVRSAMANALSNSASLSEDDLFVSAVMISDGPRQKRLWRRAKGKADIQLKRTSHIYVKVAEKQAKEGSK